MIRPWPYVVLGIVLAAVAAGSLVGLEFTAFIFLTDLNYGSLESALFYGLLAAVVATVVFLIGLIPAVAIWLPSHAAGRRSCRDAAITGAFAASAVGVLLASPVGWEAWFSLLWLAGPGAAAGLIIQRIAVLSITPHPPRARP